MMRSGLYVRMLAAACGVAAMSAIACDRNANTRSAGSDNSAAPPTASAATAERQDITATGCLQKNGGDYVLTQINEPDAAAAPTAKKGDESKVEREQLHAAQEHWEQKRRSIA